MAPGSWLLVFLLRVQSSAAPCAAHGHPDGEYRTHGAKREATSATGFIFFPAKGTLNAAQKQTHGHADGCYPVEYVERIQSDAFASILPVSLQRNTMRGSVAAWLSISRLLPNAPIPKGLGKVTEKQARCLSPRQRSKMLT